MKETSNAETTVKPKFKPKWLFTTMEMTRCFPLNEMFIFLHGPLFRNFIVSLLHDTVRVRVLAYVDV